MMILQFKIISFQRIKPYSKYTLEGSRPRSPNTQYSNLTDDLVKQNQEVR